MADKKILLKVYTLSGSFEDEFNIHQKLQHVIDKAFNALHITPADGEVWELRYGDQILDPQRSIQEAGLPDGAVLNWLRTKAEEVDPMDPTVSKAKFDREIGVIMDEAARFIEAASWEILDASYPNLAVVLTHRQSKRQIGFRFLCDEWDDLPPSLSLFDPSTGCVLPWASWPQQGWNAGDRHPVTGHPFLCLPGIREYHIHPSHLNDKWENLRRRESYALRYIVDRVHQRFGDTHV